MIIWDEYQYGEEIFNSKKLKTKKYEYKELKCLIKFMLEDGYKLVEIRNRLYEICNDDLRYITDKQRKLVFNKLIQQSQTEIIIHDKRITIYKKEIEGIQKLNNINLEKLIFIMLVYCKWLNNIEWFFVLNIDLIISAKLTNFNSKLQQELFFQACNSGLIHSDIKKVKSNGYGIKNGIKQMWNITFLQDDGDVAFEFNNYINVVYRYLAYINNGIGYFECKNCGGIFIQESNRHQRCNKCNKKERQRINKSYYIKNK